MISFGRTGILAESDGISAAVLLVVILSIIGKQLVGLEDVCTEAFVIPRSDTPLHETIDPVASQF